MFFSPKTPFADANGVLFFLGFLNIFQRQVSKLTTFVKNLLPGLTVSSPCGRRNIVPAFVKD